MCFYVCIQITCVLKRCYTARAPVIKRVYTYWPRGCYLISAYCQREGERGEVRVMTVMIGRARRARARDEARESENTVSRRKMRVGVL